MSVKIKLKLNKPACKRENKLQSTAPPVDGTTSYTLNSQNKLQTTVGWCALNKPRANCNVFFS